MADGVDQFFGPNRPRAPFGSDAIDMVTGIGRHIRDTGHLGEKSATGGAWGVAQDVWTAAQWPMMAVGFGEGKAASNNCFIAGTPVQMADGTTRAIELVKSGDWVKSRDAATGKDIARQVVRTFVNEAQGTLLRLRFANGEEVTTTVGHPFYVEGRGFVLAGELGIGTSIVTRAGPQPGSTVVSMQQHPGETAPIYNFEVKGTHTYFVGTQDGGVWVHNQSLKPINGAGSDFDVAIRTVAQENGVGGLRGMVKPIGAGEMSAGPKAIVRSLEDSMQLNRGEYSYKGINSSNGMFKVWFRQAQLMVGK